jgi:glycosyltransferase involved in cell wall biosynthesis
VTTPDGVQESIVDRTAGEARLVDRIRRGRLRAERFSWTRYAEQMVNVYRRVLGVAVAPAS